MKMFSAQLHEGISSLVLLILMIRSCANDLMAVNASTRFLHILTSWYKPHWVGAYLTGSSPIKSWDLHDLYSSNWIRHMLLIWDFPVGGITEELQLVRTTHLQHWDLSEGTEDKLLYLYECHVRLYNLEGVLLYEFFDQGNASIIGSHLSFKIADIVAEISSAADSRNSVFQLLWGFEQLCDALRLHPQELTARSARYIGCMQACPPYINCAGQI